MSHAWAGGSTRAWRRIRAHVLTRDAGQGCRAHRDGWCDRANRTTTHHCTDTPDTAHHTRGKAHGDDPRHIVAACRPCNLHIGDPTRHDDPPGRSTTKW